MQKDNCKILLGYTPFPARKFCETLAASELKSCTDWLRKVLKLRDWLVCNSLSSSSWLRSVKILFRSEAAELAIPIILSI